ncbi:polysaccharide deacetylase family protein [Pedobacter nyackensis]|uniref:Polysaccharide deacetylase n=1 Tax=Pedobacter nyackensis TaxID=475255 RepID=A0A1W1ZYY7_9SPHI|nr:hypothetical protein [Pedobacter nyackensis]SMC53371.1 hypothetical protein SAMN04488101_101151 [Pedobacter nyackensis]
MKARFNYIMGDPAPIDPNKLITKVKFASAPSSAVAAIAPRKFNKKNHWAFEWDDASSGAVTGLGILNNAFYTDGCGNSINYSGTLAINGANENTPEAYPLDGYAYSGADGRASLTQMITMINAGWEISDHSYYHDPVGKGALYTAYQMTVMMQTYIQERLNYWTRSKVVPTNYAGHATAARDLGYLYSTSQGTFDSFTAEWVFAPPGNWVNVPADFAPLRRDFTDNWPGSLTNLQNMVTTLKAATGKFFRVGSHTINTTAFQSLVDFLVANSGDEFLVSSTREWLEYDEVRVQPITQSLLGDTLTITSDLTGLDPKNRWRDLSFNITSDQTIESVTTVGGDSSSFNPATGLVNVFKQINEWL